MNFNDICRHLDKLSDEDLTKLISLFVAERKARSDRQATLMKAALLKGDIVVTFGLRKPEHNGMVGQIIEVKRKGAIVRVGTKFLRIPLSCLKHRDEAYNKELLGSGDGQR